MKELLAMLEHRIPAIRTTQTWKRHSFRWVRNYQELQNLRIRRPEIYEAAVNGLVNYIANRAAEELESPLTFEEKQRRYKRPNFNEKRNRGG